MYWNVTSSTAQGGGGSFKNRKPIGEIGCCESGMAERSHWWTERCLISLTLSLSFSGYLPTYPSIFYVSIYLSIYRSIVVVVVVVVVGVGVVVVAVAVVVEVRVVKLVKLVKLISVYFFDIFTSKKAQSPQFFTLLTSKCASRPRARSATTACTFLTLFRHLNLQKWSETVSF